MDALALLCTLHADGPATLKALRGLGANSLGDVVAADPKRFAEGIGMTPAAARRLVREARILAQRLDLEGLDAEEAPPEAAAGSAILGSVPGTPPPPSIPVESTASQASGAELAPADLDLVSRIVGGAESAQELTDLPMEAPEAPEATVALEPPSEPELAAEPMGTELVEVPSADVEESTPMTIPGQVVVGGLPGLDEAMVEDLAAAGICSYAQLAAAESLSLTRNLGVTFAQARRLRFLARRAADDAATVPPEGAPEGGAELREVELQPMVPAAPVAAPAPVAEPVQAAEPKPEPEVQPEPESEPEPKQESAPVADPTPEAADPERPHDRKAFWESRLLEQPETPEEPQGVKVDPDEIAARPRFGDQFAKAVRERQAQRPASPSGRTILGWNFEIPRPEAEPLPFTSMGSGASGAVPVAPEPSEVVAEGGAPAGKESGEAAGPFA